MGGCDFEAKRFSVSVGESEAYRDNYDRIFGKKAASTTREFTLAATLTVGTDRPRTDEEWEAIRTKLQAGLVVVTPTSPTDLPTVVRVDHIKVFAPE